MKKLSNAGNDDVAGDSPLTVGVHAEYHPMNLSKSIFEGKNSATRLPVSQLYTIESKAARQYKKRKSA